MRDKWIALTQRIEILCSLNSFSVINTGFVGEVNTKIVELVQSGLVYLSVSCIIFSPCNDLVSNKRQWFTCSFDIFKESLVFCCYEDLKQCWFTLIILRFTWTSRIHHYLLYYSCWYYFPTVVYFIVLYIYIYMYIYMYIYVVYIVYIAMTRSVNRIYHKQDVMFYLSFLKKYYFSYSSYSYHVSVAHSGTNFNEIWIEIQTVFENWHAYFRSYHSWLSGLNSELDGPYMVFLLDVFFECIRVFC